MLILHTKIIISPLFAYHNYYDLSATKDEKYFKPWNFSLRFGYLDFGNFIDNRFLYVFQANHYGEKANSKFCYTRTNTDFSNSLQYSYDFAENLFGFSLSRRHKNKGWAQIHLLLFQNNDWLTDNGWIFGAKYGFNFMNMPANISYEVNTLNFIDLNIIQNTIEMNFDLTKNWKVLPGINFSFIQNAEAARAETRTPVAVFSKIYYNDYNFNFVIQSFIGKRIFYYDSDYLYAPMNNYDSYKSGLSIRLIQKARHLDLYSEYGIYSAISKYLRASKQPFWKSIDYNYTLKLITLGGSIKF